MSNANSDRKEVWMRGPVPGIPGLLQPIAHTLLQVQEDIIRYTSDLNTSHLWEKPFGRASIAFHIQHIIGVTDRMFTYAQGKPLSEEQFGYLQREGLEDPTITLDALVHDLEQQISKALELLQSVDPASLTEPRYLGRKRIPTTLIGLLFHAAEHAQRHVGQLLVTASVVRAAD